MTDAVFYAVWLLLHDLPFAKQHGQDFSSFLFPKGALQALAALGVDQAVVYRRTTTLAVLELVLTHGFPVERYGTTEDEVRLIYHDLDNYRVTLETRGRLVELVLSWRRKRQLGVALDDAATALDKEDETGAAQALSQARRVGTTQELPLRLDDNLVGSLGQLPDNAVTTGFKKLDRWWYGGARPGEFGVVLAATNVGKTQTMCFMASAAFKQNKRVLYYSFELHQSQVLRRIAAAVLVRPASEIPVDDAPDMLKQIRLNRGITNGYIEVRQGDMTVDDLLMDIDELDRQDEKPDIVLLDSADDLIAHGKYQSDYQRLGEIYRDLRGLALAADIVLWTSTQATREAIDKARISLKHMGDSFWKARRAHFVLGFTQTKSEAEYDPLGGSMSVFILKDSQHGTPGRGYQVRPKFGPQRDGDGYPGFDEMEQT